MTPHSALVPCSFDRSAPSSALELTARALQPLLSLPGLTELCINRPGEAFIETSTGWHRESIAWADYAWCQRIAKLVANATRQRITEENPLLSATLPGGERIQVVIPPATPAGVVAMSIRKPSASVWSLKELTHRGVFAHTRRAGEAVGETTKLLRELLKAREYESFLRLAVQSRLNIVTSGATGTGKTTFCKALIQEIPTEERLITIEDAQELQLPNHPNHVRLVYSKDGQGLARVTPKQLLECALRMRADRLLVAELRAAEAFDYVRATAAHPGSITSVHASSAQLAFEQLILLIKQAPGGAELPRSEIHALLRQVVDVVVQFGRDRSISEIWYAPGDPHGEYANN